MQGNMANFDQGYQNSFELGNEYIDDDDTAKEGDDDDAVEDQQTDQFCSKYSPLLIQGGTEGLTFVGKGNKIQIPKLDRNVRKLFQKIHSNEMTN